MFNVIEAVANNVSLEKVKEILNDFIMKNKIITSVYNALDGNVYGEAFLKPLMLSIDYQIREKLLTEFYPLDKDIHMDHILPKKYYEKPEEWEYINDKEEALKYLNTIGNMALLLGQKNKEALNYGVTKKIYIYLGKDNFKTGRVAFDTTNLVIDEFKNSKKWTIESIKNRKIKLIKEIEKMLNISRECIEKENLYIETADNNFYFKWQYKNQKYTNSSLVRTLLVDYINSKNFKSYEDIDDEIKYYHIIPSLPLFSENNIFNGYNYGILTGIDFDLYTPSQFNKERIQSFLEILKKYFDFEKNLIKL